MKVNTITIVPLFNQNIGRLITCFFLVSSIAIGGPSGYRFTGEQKTAKVSFQLVDNLVIIPVKVNDRLTLQFILDSGTRTPMILQPNVAKRLNLAYGRAIMFSGPGGKEEVKGMVANNVKLELPGIIATGMSVVVLNKDHLKIANFPVQVHGVMGYGLFSRFIVDIDYDSRLIRLYEPENFIPDFACSALAIELHDTKPFIKASLSVLGNEKFETVLLIDTGAGTGLILDSHAFYRLSVGKNKRKQYIGRGVCGEIKGWVTRVKCLQIGDHSLLDMKAAFTNKNFYPSRETLKSHGSIGGKILSKFRRIVIDYVNEKLYILEKGTVQASL